MSAVTVKSYRDLIVWQKAFDLVLIVYRLTKSFPKDERFGLINQVRRASVSIVSNIAEGHARESSGEYRHFLSYSRASLAEVETQLLIAKQLEYVKPEDVSEAFGLLIEINKMINAIMKKLPKKTYPYNHPYRPQPDSRNRHGTPPAPNPD